MRKQTVQKATLICKYCNKEFQRYPSYIREKESRGTIHFYCSRSCAGKHKHPPGSRAVEYVKDDHPEFRRLVARTKQNSYIKKSRKNKRAIEANIGVKDIIALWKLQEGKCAISGLEMVLKTTGKPIYNQASIDRIDPNKGYTKDNIRLICLIANYALNRFSDEELITFCNAVAQQ